MSYSADYTKKNWLIFKISIILINEEAHLLIFKQTAESCGIRSTIIWNWNESIKIVDVERNNSGFVFWNQLFHFFGSFS